MSQCVVKHVKIEFADESEYERLKEWKEARGLTWRSMLHMAAGLDSGGPEQRGG